jgi:hypothetical protein
MAQTGPETPQPGPHERPYGQYTIREDGNSVAVTIPRMMELAAGTTMRIRAGRWRGRVIYLKALPIETAFSGQPGTETVTTTAQGERITEEKVGRGEYSVHDGTNKSLVIPDGCETDRFPKESAPMLVAGTTEMGFVYVKIIPECLYEAVWSIASDDLITVAR